MTSQVPRCADHPNAEPWFPGTHWQCPECGQPLADTGQIRARNLFEFIRAPVEQGGLGIPHPVLASRLAQAVAETIQRFEV
jgi:hypothetical protein